MVSLGKLPFKHDSIALATSADGSVVVGYGGSNALLGPQAFRWTADGGMMAVMEDLPGVIRSVADDVSADGSVVVGYGQFATGGLEALMWDPINGTRELDQFWSSSGLTLGAGP